MKKNVLTEMEQAALIKIRRGQCTSRAEISRALGISRPTASVVAEKLLEIQALTEIGLGKSSRGKLPTLLSPVPEFQYTIGLDLGYTKQIVGILLDGKNQIVRKEKIDFDNSSIEDICNKSMMLVKKLSSAHSITGIGVALSGIIEPGMNKIIRSINPLFTEHNIQEIFTEWSRLPVIVENRSRAAAFSEAFGGAADLQKNFILLSLGKSIGAAFWLNNTVFQGCHGTAGEIRSIRLADGRTLEESLSIENVQKYSEDELVSICVEGLHQLTEIMDLELLVLTGRFTDFSAGFLKKLTQKLAVYRRCRIMFSNYGRYSAARGIAMRISETLLS